jgi:putative FmdB family regulatory protein
VPIYGYRCNTCGAEVEKRQSFTDAPLTTCESCGGSLRRLLHPVGIVFKGSGFYNTDNRKAAAGTNGDGAKSSENGESGKTATESKPAASTSSSESSTSTTPPPSKSDSSASKPAAPSKT